MTKKDKLISRFLSQPRDFDWSELKRLLENFGYVLESNSGSRRKFYREGLDVIIVHEPHPDSTIPRYIMKQVKEKLKLEGLI